MDANVIRGATTVSRGRAGIFEDLVEEYLDGVYRTALFMMRERQDAEDVSQEVLVRAWKHASKLREPVKARAWIQRITINVALNHLKRRRVAISYGTGPVEAAAPAVASSNATMSEAVDRLSANHRIVLFLRFAEGLSYREIGERLDCPEGTAKSRIHYALTALRAEYDSIVR